jgi:uncharacterized protein YacL
VFVLFLAVSVLFFVLEALLMSIEFIFRLIGMTVLAVLGGYAGVEIEEFNGMQLSVPLLVLTGALVGLILTPYVTTRPMRTFRSLLGRIAAETLFAGLVGLVSGLIVAALLSSPLSMLPGLIGNIAPFLGVLLFAYLGVALFLMRQGDIMGMLSAVFSRNGNGGQENGSNGANWSKMNRTILLDTSVIIDGRIADIARTGFLPGTLLIPRFVLNELQYVADSPDGLRRQRGRRGMDVLATLQKDPNVMVRISDIDVDGVREVDSKLVVLGKQLKCPVLTNDFNLNKVAELQGVTVLNINDLANAVKSVVLPGEIMHINIIQEGKERDQGVGYMEDGTMVVVENGREEIGEYADVSVTKVLQTAAGRMIFARISTID